MVAQAQESWPADQLSYHPDPDPDRSRALSYLTPTSIYPIYKQLGAGPVKLNCKIFMIQDNENPVLIV